MPRVLADHDTVLDASEFEHERLRVGGEVAFLVEHLGVRQILLAIGALHFAVDDQRCRIERIDWRQAALDRRVCITMAVRRAVREVVRPVAQRMADDHMQTGERLQLCGEIGQRGRARGIERGAQQQVFGRITRQREFRRDQQLRTIAVRGARGGDDLRDVAGEVADGDIDLSKSDSGLHGRIDRQAFTARGTAARWLDGIEQTG
ncbi:hypothetical protein OKW44_004712 [Paraburkholderia sp. WSM4174]